MTVGWIRLAPHRHSTLWVLLCVCMCAVQSARSKHSTRLRIIKIRLQFPKKEKKKKKMFVTFAVGNLYFFFVSHASSETPTKKKSYYRSAQHILRIQCVWTLIQGYYSCINFILLIRMSKNDYYFVRRRAKIWRLTTQFSGRTKTFGISSIKYMRALSRVFGTVNTANKSNKQNL